MIEKIEYLRAEKSPEEIEQLLLNGKLGKIWIHPLGYQYIGNIQLSHLVVGVYMPEFINWMHSYLWKYVIHHIDGNPLNNVSSNLLPMTRSYHSWIHRHSPKFADIEKEANRKCSETLTGHKVSEATRAKLTGRKVSKSTKVKMSEAHTGKRHSEVSKTKMSEAHSIYEADESNIKAIKARSKKGSETKRKRWTDLSKFTEPFIIWDYAETSNISYKRAEQRLAILLSEGKVTCEKKLIDNVRHNIYRRKEK